MPRPLKYATAKEASHHNLYSKLAGQNLGLSLEQFIHHATDRCELCGLPPQEVLVVDRKDGRYTLAWHYVVRTEDGHMALCKTCKTLCQMFEIRALISHCARIMARRMWQVHSKWTNMLFQGQDKLTEGRSPSNPTTGINQ